MSKAIDANTLELISTQWTVATADLSCTRGELVAVVGGEGAGRTLLCVNLALVAARSGKRVVIVETSGGRSAAHLFLNATPDTFVSDVAKGTDVLDAVCFGTHGVGVVASNGPVGHGTLERQRLMRAIDRLSRRYDLVFVDCDPRGGPETRLFGREADRCLLAVHADTERMDEAARTVRSLASIGVSEISVVVGHAKNAKQARDTFAYLGNAVSLVSGVKLTHLGDVADDEEVGRAVMWLQPVVDHAPFSRAGASLRRVCAALLSQPEQPALHGETLFERAWASVCGVMLQRVERWA